jgi:hypothetical protein
MQPNQFEMIGNCGPIVWDPSSSSSSGTSTATAAAATTTTELRAEIARLKEENEQLQILLKIM